MKKILSLLLSIILSASVFTGLYISADKTSGDINGDGEIDNKDVVTLFRYVSGNTDGVDPENCDYNGDGEIDNKDVVALFRAVSAEIPPEETTGDENPPKEKTGWEETIDNANALANGVQGKFTDAARRKFTFSNKNASLLYDLSSSGEIGLTGIYNPNGDAYFDTVSDVIIALDDGKEFSSAQSVADGRMNSHRLGCYYYDFRFCNQNFVNSNLPEFTEGEDYYDIIANSASWAVHDTSSVSVKSGVMSYTVSNPYDPYIISSGINFRAADYDAVQITLKTQYASGGNIYIIAGSHGNFSEEQDISFKCRSGDWATCIVPVSVAADYTGYVTGFRLDIGAEAGERIEIKEIKAIKRGSSSVPFQLERVFHTYSDKVHEVVRIVATNEYSGGGKFLSQIVIPESKVSKIVLKNSEMETISLGGFDFSSTEYVGFDIKGAGVFGIIMPALDNNGELYVELIDGNYVISHIKEISGTIAAKGDVYFGHRIYTSQSHKFDGLKKEAYIERNPLTDVKVTKKSEGSKYVGYDALAGFYKFTIRGTDFSTAYYTNPDKHYRINASFTGDGVTDRTVYVKTAEPNGMLECAALLDENECMIPVPLEVGKNFRGEFEEPFYDPDDTSYGEVYVPVTIDKDETKSFAMLHLYQNWGNYPLKQISFIAFHICYYHLSVGVTETNCIAPYFVYGKDGWTLPDFRANSAPLWSSQPQHTSAGRLYFLQYTDSSGNSFKSESQSADIVSAGPVYADINMEYLSDDGKIKATYRHTEMPQTDENRTYYNIRLEVLDDVTINNFKTDFSFFKFDGRSVKYSYTGYLDENGNMKTESVKYGARMIKLGKEYPYYDYYGGNNGDSVNFALIVRRSDITIGGKKYDGNFMFRDSYDGNLNYGSLSLDLGKVTLKKGDVLDLDIILLPWGYSTSTDDSNVRNVRADSCIDPYKLTVIKGKAVEDDFIPSVKAENDTAKFKLSGGKNNVSVRVYGFKDYTAPKVTVKADGADTDFKLNGSAHTYDGYQVYLDEDGTYSFSFVLNMDKAEEYEITVTQ